MSIHNETEEKLALAMLALGALAQWYDTKKEVPKMPRHIHQTFKDAKKLLGWKVRR